MLQKAYKWAKRGDGHYPFQEEEGSVLEFLTPGIYTLEQSMIGLFLNRQFDAFSFEHKIYGVNENFINRCVATYKETQRNLGILLNGTKGTGKTVTAKILANTFGLPVILVDNVYNGHAFKFLSDNIRQDVVILFDEFEKTVSKEEQEKMLTFMDGISSDTNRKIFILTSNTLNIDGNLLSRPSRVRYHKSFGNLSLEVLEEVATDMLGQDVMHFKESLLEVLQSFSIITMDNVVQFINELNIHKIEPKELVMDFNICRNSIITRFVEITDSKEVIIAKWHDHPQEFDKEFSVDSLGRCVKIEGDIVTMMIYNNLAWLNICTREDELVLRTRWTDFAKVRNETSNKVNINLSGYLGDFVYYDDEACAERMGNLLEVFSQEEIDKYFFRKFRMEAAYESNETFRGKSHNYGLVY